MICFGSALILGIFAVLLVYRRFSREVPVLMYHRIADIPGDRLSIPPSDFEKELEYLKANGFYTLSLDEYSEYLMQKSSIPRKSILLTFDDGYENNYLNALPLLQKYNMRGTVFVISDWVGKDNDWEDYRGKPHCRTMTWEQIAEWQAAGMAVGGHTANHSSLTEISDDELRRELVNDKKCIEEHLGKPVTFMAYPRGFVDTRVAQAVRDAGYTGGFAIFDETSMWRNDPYVLRRMIISAPHSAKSFAFKVSPWHVLSIAGRKFERQISGWKKK